MPFRTHKNSGLEPLRTKRMTHSPAQMDDMGLNPGSTANNGKLRQVYFFSFHRGGDGTSPHTSQTSQGSC